ncbi:MAG: hypothetical protein ACKOEO_18920 [Planctomycetaceae bacterium]
MPIAGPLDYLPIWALFSCTFGVVLAAIELGYRIGRVRRLRFADELESPVAAIVAAALGLLGLILAFTFGLAAARFDARGLLVVEEANAIGTTWLRAGLLPDVQRVLIRQLLADYTDVRLDVVQTGDLGRALNRSAQLHRELWLQAEALGRAQPGSIMVGLFIQSLNETIDIHSKRLLIGVRSRLPATLWLTLYLVTLLTMSGVGYHEGLSRSRRSLVIVVLVAAFSAVITLAADLDRPQEGLLRVSQQPMLDLRGMMDAGF